MTEREPTMNLDERDRTAPEPWSALNTEPGSLAAAADAQQLASDGWFLVSDPLTQQQRFRLVEIAHETTDPTIKAAALGMLGGGT